MGGSVTTKFLVCVSCKQGILLQSHQTAFRVRTLTVVLSYPVVLRYHLSFTQCPSNAFCSKRIQSRVTTVVRDPVSCLRSCHGCSWKFPALRTLQECGWGKHSSLCFVRLIHLDRVFSYMQSLVRAPNRKLLNLPEASFYGLPISITISSSLSYSPKKLFPLGKSSGFMFLIFLVPLAKFCVLIYFGH